MVKLRVFWDHLKNRHPRLAWGDNSLGDPISVYGSLFLFEVSGDDSSGGDSEVTILQVIPILYRSLFPCLQLVL